MGHSEVQLYFILFNLRIFGRQAKPTHKHTQQVEKCQIEIVETSGTASVSSSSEARCAEKAEMMAKFFRRGTE